MSGDKAPGDRVRHADPPGEKRKKPTGARKSSTLPSCSTSARAGTALAGRRPFESPSAVELLGRGGLRQIAIHTQT